MRKDTRAHRETTRARRAARRAARHERDRHESALHATLMSTTSLSAASFLITISRSTILKIDDALIVSTMDLALAGFLLMGFGILCLWSAPLVRAPRRAKVFVFSAYALCSLCFWSVSGYEEIAEPAREATFYQELNPQRLVLPTSTCSMYSRDSDFILSLDEDEVWFGRKGRARLMGSEGAGVEQAARGLFDEARREKDLLRQAFEPPTVSISADHCAGMGELDAYAQRLMTEGVHRFTFNTFTDWDIESRRLPDLIPAEAYGEDATSHGEEAVVRLSREGVEVSVGGRVVASERCRFGEDSACEEMVRVQDSLCMPIWNQQSLSRKLEGEFGSVALEERPAYVLVVEPDVALFHVVTLHGIMRGAFVGEWGDQGQCVRERVILPDGRMRISKPLIP